MAHAPRPGTYRSPTAPPERDPGTPDFVLVYEPAGGDEQRVPFWLDEVTPDQARTVRLVTKISVNAWVNDFVGSGGDEVDSFAVVLWLARMQNGETALTYNDVVENMRHGDRRLVERGVDAEGEPVEPREMDADPEA